MIGLVMMVIGLIVAIVPLARLDGSSQELFGSDLVQYCIGSAGALVGSIVCGVWDAIEARRSCPRCGRSGTWGLYCDSCSREIAEKNN